MKISYKSFTFIMNSDENEVQEEVVSVVYEETANDGA